MGELSGLAHSDHDTYVRVSGMPADQPAGAAPARRPGSLRRTSTVEVSGEAELRIEGAARDLRTDEDGDGRTLDQVRVEAELDAQRRVRTLSIEGEPTELLDGVVVGPGFRRAADAAFPDAVGRALGCLLDDLPIGVLLSGYATLREAQRFGGADPGQAVGPEMEYMADLCSGWRSQGTLMTSIRRGRGVPMQDAPAARPLTAENDPLAWHEIGSLAHGTIRRTRRLDVLVEDDSIAVDAFFRDSYGEPDGTEIVLHEYGMSAVVDPATFVVRDAVADAHVLPYDECSDAAGSARTLVGTSVADARRTVRERSVGISSCTHLNDLLVTLSCLPVLLETPRR
jgi:hypothetical protein